MHANAVIALLAYGGNQLEGESGPNSVSWSISLASCPLTVPGIDNAFDNLMFANQVLCDSMIPLLSRLCINMIERESCWRRRVRRTKASCGRSWCPRNNCFHVRFNAGHNFWASWGPRQKNPKWPDSWKPHSTLPLGNCIIVLSLQQNVFICLETRSSAEERNIPNSNKEVANSIWHSTNSYSSVLPRDSSSEVHLQSDLYHISHIRELHPNIYIYIYIRTFEWQVFWNTSGKVFPGPPGHLNVRNPSHINVTVSN